MGVYVSRGNCVFKGDLSIKERISEEAHSSKYFVPLGGHKMYRDLQCISLVVECENIATFLSTCLTCYEVKRDY